MPDALQDLINAAAEASELFGDDECERYAKELQKKIKNQKIKADVQKILGLTDENFRPGFMHSAYADCHVELTAPTLNEALVIAEKMNPIHLVIVKDGCTSFRPLDTLPDKLQDKAEVITPWVYKIHGLRGCPDKHTLSFYVKAGDYIVEVWVHVERDTNYRRDYEINFHRSGSANRRYCHLLWTSRYFSHHIRWWASDDQPNDFTLYDY